MSESPIHFMKYIEDKEALISIDNSKQSAKSSTKHCNSTNFCIVQIGLQNALFFFTNLSHNYITKNLNIACTPTEMKQNLLH